jgi:hypothetical protein
VVHTISCVFLVFSSLLLVTPNQFPVTLDTFNWSPVVTGGLVAALLVYWNASASSHFGGPPRVDAGNMDGGTAYSSVASTPVS